MNKVAVLSLLPVMLLAQKLGMSWTRATASAAWPARRGQTSVVYDGKMWVMGGESNTSPYIYNDVWYSTDGVTWTQATAHAAWPARSYFASVVFDNKMWVIGGDTTRDVWYSTDGVTWTQATDHAGWTARDGHTSVVFDNKMWVIGGHDLTGPLLNDIWYSTDGVTWTQAPSNWWTARDGHTSVVFGNEMWVLGGEYEFRPYAKSDVWYSTSGSSWTEATDSAAWRYRMYHTSVVFASNLWVIGGWTNNGPDHYIWYDLNDVWYSPDGASWTQATASAGWTPRDGHTSVVFDNKIWVFGGQDSSKSYKNDVWYSSPVLDAGAARIIAPTGTVDSGITAAPQAVVRNFGDIPASFTTHLGIGAFYLDSKSVSNLAPGDSVVLTYRNWVALQRGTHVVKCWTTLSGDMQPGNDTVTDSVAVRVRDVTARRILAPVDTVDSGAVITPRAVVSNLGTAAATFVVRMAVGGFYADSQNVSNLLAGDSATVSFSSWTATQMGTHAVRCSTMLPGDMVPANDRLDGAVTVVVRTDVGVTAVMSPRDTIPEGTLVMPLARVKNFGTYSASFEVDFKIGSVYADSQQVSGLAPGDSATLVFTSWTATRGAYSVKCSTAMTGDEDPSNDAITCPLFVSAYDVGALRILNPSGSAPVDSGSITSPQLLVKNFGNIATPVPAVFNIGSFYTDTNTLANLNPGDSGVISFGPWQALLRGAHVMTCRTLLANDGNPANDTCSGTVSVRVRDVGPIRIVAPLDTVDSGSTVAPIAVVRNFGTTTETFSVQLRIGGFYANNQAVSNLSAGESASVTFANWQAVQGGTHAVRCSTLLVGDMYLANDLVVDSVTVGYLTGVNAEGPSPVPFFLDASAPNPMTASGLMRFGVAKACENWRQETNEQGVIISFGIDGTIRAEQSEQESTTVGLSRTRSSPPVSWWLLSRGGMRTWR